jgi:hypothetical protein
MNCKQLTSGSRVRAGNLIVQKPSAAWSSSDSKQRGNRRMELLQAIFILLVYLALLGAGLALAWWAFRMVFWIVILFIGEAGRARRGE